MSKKILTVVLYAGLSYGFPAYASDDLDALRDELLRLKKEYGQRIQALEKKLQQAKEHTKIKLETVENKVDEIASSHVDSTKQNNFNPALSLVLDGQYSNFDNNPEDYQLPGFMLGSEAGLGSRGFALGESEITLGSNIDDKFYGQATLSFSGNFDGAEVSVEEAYIQTLGLGYGITIKAGRFFSAIGYLNEQHAHVWDFADAPLIYRGLFGDQLTNDGIQISYLLPTDLYMQIGGEVMSGSQFPAGGSFNGVGAWSVYFNVGDDVGIEHSWQLGLNHWQADNIDNRESTYLGTTTSFSGDSQINSLDFVYKWAPNGNPIDRNFKLQFEYFDRLEDGLITANSNHSSYDGHQSGWYLQGIYQFFPQWRAGLRYDQLDSHNKGSNNLFLANAGLDDRGHSPKRYSAMLEWLPSEFSRIRLQYNHDESYQDSDDQLFVQYTYSLGSHGAHQY